MKGRKPTPTNLRIVRGNPGRRPLNQNEARVEGAMPKPPKMIQGEARKEWRRISRLLFDAGLLTKIDGQALVAYCQTYARWLDAEDEIRRSGPVIKAFNGQPMVSPFLKVSNIAWAQWTRMLVEFGMTPSSRSRVKATPPATEDKFADFIAQNKK